MHKTAGGWEEGWGGGAQVELNAWSKTERPALNYNLTDSNTEFEANKHLGLYLRKYGMPQLLQYYSTTIRTTS